MTPGYVQTISILANIMRKLNLPEYQLNTRIIGNKNEIFDSIRKRYVILTPEEWVRQNFIQFLINEKKYPPSLFAIEKGLKVNNMFRRTDIVLYNSEAKPQMIVECKAPEVNISQDTFDQAARYNISLNVEYLTITNGIQHYCCHVNAKDKSIRFLKEIPNYKEING